MQVYFNVFNWDYYREGMGVVVILRQGPLEQYWREAATLVEVVVLK